MIFIYKLIGTITKMLSYAFVIYLRDDKTFIVMFDSDQTIRMAADMKETRRLLFIESDVEIFVMKLDCDVYRISKSKTIPKQVCKTRVKYMPLMANDNIMDMRLVVLPHSNTFCGNTYTKSGEFVFLKK
jgi:hypothetical protein